MIFWGTGGAISWRSKQQSGVAQSRVEAEYVALSFAVRGALWIKKFESVVNLRGEVFSISIKEDNQGCTGSRQFREREIQAHRPKIPDDYG